MPFALPPLPFSEDALEPHMSAETLRYHHGKHHKTYVDTLNKLVAGTRDENASLEEVIMRARRARTAESIKIFNNAGQVWNHNLFWKCLSPRGGGTPKGVLGKLMAHSFGDYDTFHGSFKRTASDLFGSGYAWLTFDGDKLRITATPDAESPLIAGQFALMCCDIWEHAYYLDHRNRRAAFVETFLNELLNWDFVEARLADWDESRRGAPAKARGHA